MSVGENLKRKTSAETEALKSPRVRWVTGAYIEVKIDKKKYNKIVDSIVHDEIERQMITGAVKEKGPLTIGEISQSTDLEPARIMQHVIVLRKKGTVTEAGEKESQYIYKIA